MSTQDEIMINQLKELKCHCEEMAKYDLLESPWRKDVEALETAVKALEEQSVLDKIRAEIEDLDIFYDNDYFSSNRDAMFKCSDVLQIIDKYRESEG